MALEDYRYTIDETIHTLEMAKKRKRGCTLLLGAGCSLSAGIPLALGFVKEIEKDYYWAYERAPKKTYAECMDTLLEDERRDLIAKYVETAKINWAHIAIACLMKSGYVDRILTTNFDPLAIRACAMLGDFPSIYDCRHAIYARTVSGQGHLLSPRPAQGFRHAQYLSGNGRKRRAAKTRL